MKQARHQWGWAAIAAWIAGVAICGLVIHRTAFTTDLSAFLPKSPAKEQQVLLNQLRDGVVSRLILVGIEGGDAATRAALSKDIASHLRDDPVFVTVNNGEPVNAERDRAFLFGNRYLLSAAVTPERFTPAGLHAAIGDTIDLLASPVGMFVKPLLPRDPTGEIIQLLEQMDGTNRPRMQLGAWASRDGARALLLAQTRAAGADIDAHQRAMQHIRQAFETARRQRGGAAEIKLVMTGPGVFSVVSRDTIRSEVTRLSIISTIIIITLLLLVYRSLTALMLGLLPVISGALAGLAAVSLGFGAVHGITLGFGTTLIGEAVDYSIYLFVQSRESPIGGTEMTDRWISKFWPTVRLGLLTSIIGFASLLLSGFPGLAQLGMFTIAGLIAAAAVTRFVLPQILPRNFRTRDVSAIGLKLFPIAQRIALLRRPLLLVLAAALAVLFINRATLWNTELGGLSPVSSADQAIDGRLRTDLGAPDTRYMIVVSGSDRESALRSSEKIAEQLQPLVAQGVLAGFENPARYLPSIATQQARQASLPGAGLQQRVEQAAIGLPVRAGLFEPFLADVAAAKIRTPLQRADLDNTSLALALDALLLQRGAQWNAVLPLTAPNNDLKPAAIPVESVRAALAAANQPSALFVDVKSEFNRLYVSYLHEAILLSLGGLTGIVVLLLIALRSPARTARVMLPLLGAVISVAALLVLCGQRMTILHLVGLLLIVAVGSNYALFFNPKDRSGENGNSADAISPQTLMSLVFANLTTVAGFGLLGFSQVPVLQAIGVTVGPGAVLALIYSAIFSGAQFSTPSREPASN